MDFTTTPALCASTCDALELVIGGPGAVGLTGPVTLSYSLWDGSTLLGSFTEVNSCCSFAFVDAIPTLQPFFGVVNFAGIQNGTIQGRILAAFGGSGQFIGLDSAYTSLYLTNTDGSFHSGDVTITGLQVLTAPEPSTWLLISGVLVFIILRNHQQPRR